MKRTASFITIGTSALFFAFVVPTSLATTQTNIDVSNNGEGAKTNVKVETNTGGNTICQNGKCTTTSNNGTSTVCVNGVCNTSENGDVNYQSDDGNTKINIKNSNSSVNVTNNTNVDVKDIEPTIKQEVQAAKDKVEAAQKDLPAGRQGLEKKIEEATQGFDFMKFLQTEFEEIKKLFTFEFLFGNR